MLNQAGQQRIGRGVSRAQLHEGHDRLSFQGVGDADRGSLCHRGMGNQCAFDFGSSDPMTCDIQHVIGTANHADVPISILGRQIAGDIGIRDVLPIALEASRVVPDGPHEVRERTFQDEPSADPGRQ